MNDTVYFIALDYGMLCWITLNPGIMLVWLFHLKQVWTINFPKWAQLIVATIVPVSHAASLGKLIIHCWSKQCWNPGTSLYDKGTPQWQQPPPPPLEQAKDLPYCHNIEIPGTTGQHKCVNQGRPTHKDCGFKFMHTVLYMCLFAYGKVRVQVNYWFILH